MNNNRNSGRGYPQNSSHSGSGKPRNHASNETGNRTGYQNVRSGYSGDHTQGGNGHSVNRNRRSPIRTYPPQVKPPINWIPIFTVAIALIIVVGIVFALVNLFWGNKDEAEDKNAYVSDAADTAEDTSADDEISGDTQKISVTYASVTSETKDLGSSIASDYGILINLGMNTVTAAKDPDATIFPASMTKVMTLIVAYESCKNLDDKFTMTLEITDPLFAAGASVAGFAVGEQITIRDLLYGAILPSGGDATDALAIYTAGSIEAFVDMMNRKVLEMGLSNTHFKNPSGLHDDDHYSTPHEMALILQYALKIEECKKILCTYQYTTSPTPQHPNGILLTSTMFSRMKGDESGVAEIVGGKTGFTNEGLHCLASYAKVGSDEYVLVTAHAPAMYDPVYDCINVYKNLFGE